MISRRILAAAALLCAIASPAYAQKTKAALNAEIVLQFPDNTAGAITPLVLRTVTLDMINSIMPTAPVVSGNFACFNGTTGLLQDCGLSPTGSPIVTVVATIAALKALTPPVVSSTIYVQGYASLGDGGEGSFTYNTSSSTADNGGTVLQPNSLPSTGRWIREFVGENGNVFNVKWFGAKGNNSTNDQTAVTAATTAAIAVKGDLYFPATSGCYVAKVTIPTGTVGLRIHGDTPGVPISTGSSCVASVDATATLEIQSTLGGNTNTILIENIQFINSTGGADAIRMTNVISIIMRNVIAVAAGTTATAAVNVVGTGNFSFYDVQTIGSTGVGMKIGQSGSTSSGPGTVKGGEITLQTGTAATCLVITGQASVIFDDVQFSCFGPNMANTVTIDGDGTVPQAGIIQFFNCHGESNYNSSANTGADFLIGNTNKAGTVSFINWNGFGQGNLTSFQRDSIRVVAAQNVTVRDSGFSKLTATNGYSRGGIRLETTFPAAGDIYLFENNFANVSGTLYSDANGRCVGTASCIFGGSIFDFIGTAAPVTKTGTSGSQGANDSSLIINASGSYTLTLLSASANCGRWINIKSIAAQTVVSASSNVVPRTTATPGTALLASGAGNWASLQSDCTNWVVMSGN